MQPGFPPLLSDRWESRSVTLVVSLSSTNTTQQTRYPQSQGQLRLRSQLSPPKLRHLVARYPLAFCRVENGRLRRSLECRPNTNHTVPLLEFKPLSHTRRFPAESYILTLSDLLKHAVYTCVQPRARVRHSYSSSNFLRRLPFGAFRDVRRRKKYPFLFFFVDSSPRFSSSRDDSLQARSPPLCACLSTQRHDVYM